MAPGRAGHFCRIIPAPNMSTTGKRYIDRTHDKRASRVLDAKTKTVLSAVLSEPPGECLRAYLFAKGMGPGSRTDP
jgi:hypothetical protein